LDATEVRFFLVPVFFAGNQGFSVVFVLVHLFVEHISIDRVCASAQIVHNTVRKVDDVVEADHVVARCLVEAPCLATGRVASLLDTPLQATGIPVRQLEKLFNPPKGWHFLVVARHAAPVGLKNIVIGSARSVKGAEKTKNGAFYSLYLVK
jgi:hypothetical protein